MKTIQKKRWETGNMAGGQMTLSTLLRTYTEWKEQTGHSISVVRNIRNVERHIRFFNDKEVLLAEVDTDYLRRFIHYLACEAKEQRHGGLRPLCHTTSRLYLRILSSTMRFALRRGYIQQNPLESLERDDYKSISGGQRQRTYLTIDEVKRLIATPTRCVTIKRAFLFACFTGLRISDLSQLRWKDIHTSGKDVSLSIQMKKTRRCVCIPLSTNALRWLPTRRESTKVFPLPSHLGAVNAPLKTWVRKAGIDKTVTFHTSRHTFATMEITLGADLYVVSKLLGHSSITTTQIYADIVDSKRIEAVRLMDNAF